MSEYNLLKKVAISIASLALICPLALGGYNSTTVSASKRARTHHVYKHRKTHHKLYKRTNQKARHFNKLNVYKQGQLQAKKDFHSKILRNYVNNDESTANQKLFNRIKNNKTLSNHFKSSSYTKGFLKTLSKYINHSHSHSDREMEALGILPVSYTVIKDAHKYMNSHNKMVKLALRDGAYDDQSNDRASRESSHLYKTNKLYEKTFDNALAQY